MLAVRDFEPYRLFQRRADGWAYPAARGTYDGVTAVQTRVVSSGGAPLTAWASATLYPDSDTWESCAPLSGAWLKYQARYLNDDASIVAQNNLFGCGAIIAVLGQSNGLMMSAHSTAYTANFFPTWIGGNSAASPRKQWQGDADWGTAKLKEAIYTANSGQITATVNGSYGGSYINDWLSSSVGGPWDTWLDNLARIGGDVEAVAWMQGEADAYVGTPYQTYKDRLAAVYERLKSLLNRPQLPFAVVQTGASAGATQAHLEAIQQAQYDWAHATAGAIWGGSLSGLPTSDGMHITTDANGAGVIGASIGNALAAAL